MVNDHADKCAHDDRRINVDHCAFTLAFTNVGAEKLVNAAHKFLKKHLCELMSLQGRMKQQALEVRIVFVMFERVKSEAFDAAAIVASLNCISND